VVKSKSPFPPITDAGDGKPGRPVASKGRFAIQQYRNVRLGDLSRFMPQGVIRFFQTPLPLIGLRAFQYLPPESMRKSLDHFRARFRDDDILAIKILESDFISLSDVVQPMVSRLASHPSGRMGAEAWFVMLQIKVHLIDGTTGHYLRSDGDKDKDAAEKAKRRKAAEGEEGGEGRRKEQDSHLPVYSTKGCQLMGSCLVAKWQHLFSVEQPYFRFLDPRVLMLFEVLDHAPYLSANKSRRKVETRRVAWGFLRPISLKGEAVIPPEPLEALEAPRLRLQLYHYQPLGPLATAQAHFRGLSAPTGPEGHARVPAVYLQYLLQHRSRISCALLLRVYPSPRPRLDMKLPLHKLGASEEAPPTDRGAREDVSLVSGPGEGKPRMEDIVTSSTAHLRVRGPYEPCLLPNKLLHRFQVRWSQVSRPLRGLLEE
jgi:hypothetical protein